MSHNRLLENLPPEEARPLEKCLSVVRLASNQTLVEAGAPILALWFPHDCVTSTVVDTPEGATIEVGLMGMEGLVGLSVLFGRKSSNTTVIVQIAGEATRIATADFERYVVAPNGVLYRRLLQYADAFMAMVAQTAACNSLHTVDQRLARWLLMTHDRVGRAEIPLTQEFLSFMLGVRRSSVSVAAAALQRRGIIRYSRGMVWLLDRAKLQDASCACYRLVRDLTDQLYRDFSAAS